jgi:hypothetical protein
MKTIVLKLQDKTDYESHPRQFILKLLRQLNVFEKQDKFVLFARMKNKGGKRGGREIGERRYHLFSPYGQGQVVCILNQKYIQFI